MRYTTKSLRETILQGARRPSPLFYIWITKHDWSKGGPRPDVTTEGWGDRNFDRVWFTTSEEAFAVIESEHISDASVQIAAMSNTDIEKRYATDRVAEEHKKNRKVTVCTVTLKFLEYGTPRLTREELHAALIAMCDRTKGMHCIYDDGSTD